MAALGEGLEARGEGRLGNRCTGGFETRPYILNFLNLCFCLEHLDLGHLNLFGISDLKEGDRWQETVFQLKV